MSGCLLRFIPVNVTVQITNRDEESNIVLSFLPRVSVRVKNTSTSLHSSGGSTSSEGRILNGDTTSPSYSSSKLWKKSAAILVFSSKLGPLCSDCWLPVRTSWWGSEGIKNLQLCVLGSAVSSFSSQKRSDVFQWLDFNSGMAWTWGSFGEV